jgi:hypothetical protein
LLFVILRRMTFTGSGAHPASCTVGVLSPGVKRGRVVMLTTHPHLVPRSWMSRRYISSPPSASMACSGTALLFTFFFCDLPNSFHSQCKSKIGKVQGKWIQPCHSPVCITNFAESERLLVSATWRVVLMSEERFSYRRRKSVDTAAVRQTGTCQLRGPSCLYTTSEYSALHCNVWNADSVFRETLCVCHTHQRRGNDVVADEGDFGFVWKLT